MRKLTIVFIGALAFPARALPAQYLYGPESSSILGAASEFVRATWLKPMPNLVLELDPRQMPTTASATPHEVLHTQKALAGVARKGAIAIATLDSARACAGQVNAANPCRLNGFVTLSSPIQRGDSARVYGYLRIAYPAGVTRTGDAGLAAGTFELLLLRTHGQWHVAGKRQPKQ